MLITMYYFGLLILSLISGIVALWRFAISPKGGYDHLGIFLTGMSVAFFISQWYSIFSYWN